MTNYGVKLLSPELTDEAVTTNGLCTLYRTETFLYIFPGSPGADMLLSEDELKGQRY